MSEFASQRKSSGEEKTSTLDSCYQPRKLFLPNLFLHPTPSPTPPVKPSKFDFAPRELSESCSNDPTSTTRSKPLASLGEVPDPGSDQSPIRPSPPWPLSHHHPQHSSHGEFHKQNSLELHPSRKEKPHGGAAERSSSQILLERWLLHYFSRFGPIVDHKVLQGNSSKFGFVTFASEESLCEASANDLFVDGQILLAYRTKKIVQHNQEKGKYAEKARKIFVGGLPRECTKKELRKYFEKYGEIEEVFLPKGKNFKSGFGFITFVSTEAVKTIFNEEYHSIRGKWLDLKIAKARRSSSPNFTASG